jgi:shikimate dehydrogenase
VQAGSSSGRSGEVTATAPVTGATRVAAVIGDPVAHSLSPLIHNAAFRAVGLDWVYVAMPVSEGQGAAAVEAMRVLGMAGMSVTMPHKNAVIPALDEVDDDAAALDAVNCVIRDGDRLVGVNTDGAGFLGGLRADLGLEPSGARCVVIGAGGAARAVVRALAVAGAASIGVVNRTAGTATKAALLAGDRGSVVGFEAVHEADLVVNTTPVGMAEAPGVPCDPSLVRPGQAVVDLIYHPRRTRFMDEAEARGASVANGLSMLVHQAAVAFEHWTGTDAPVGVMAEAARAAAGSRGAEQPEN